MLIPYNTDAPIYHFPYATLGLIGANVVCFIVTGGGQDYSDWLILEYGNGLNPLEWFTALFYHMGLLHIIGNMLFLWAFGLVVEGKLGWKKFLLTYFGIGLIHGCIEQTIMLWYQGRLGGSAGASGVIFGLIAVAVVWAPKNDISCYFLLLIRMFEFSISILLLTVLYIIVEAALALHHFGMSSAFIHLLGAVVGFAFGVTILKRGWVDCEGWDLFSVMNGVQGSAKLSSHDRFVEPAVAATIAELATSDVPDDSTVLTKRTDRIQELLDQKKSGAAFREWKQMRHVHPGYQLPRETLYSLAAGLYRNKQWEDCSPLISEFIARFPKVADGMRLRQAAILVKIEQRPRAAMRVVETIQTGSLRDDQRRELEKIRKRAQKLIDNGHLELQSQSDPESPSDS